MKNILLMIYLSFLMISVAVADEGLGKDSKRSYTMYKFKAEVIHYGGGNEPTLMFEIDGGDGLPIKFGISQKYIDQNVEAISKYLKWSAIAKEKGDSLDRAIATVDGIDDKFLDYWNFYEIHSGYGEHTLFITPGTKMFGLSFKPNLIGEVRPASGSYLDSMKNRTIMLNEDYANRVLKKLIAFKDGKISNPKESDYQ
jgi:hypothetical protein